MKVFLRITLSIFFLSMLTGKLNAQNLDPSGSEKVLKKSYLKIEGEYLTNSVYLGRADSIITPSITPALGYYHKSGIFLNASTYYVPSNETSKLDNGSVELGYEFNLTDNFGGSVSFTKLFYSSNSTSLKSSITSTSTLSLNYNISDIITPSIQLDYNINQNGIPGDFLLNLGLAHDFIIESIFGENDNISISPGVNFNMGSQNFYKSYLQRKFKSKVIQNQLTKAIDALTPFQALDYEISLPIVYTLGKFSFTLTPTDAIAVNKLPKRLLAQYANTDNLFYTELMVSLKF